MRIDLAKYERQVVETKSLLKDIDLFIRMIESDIVLKEVAREFQRRANMNMPLPPKFPELTLWYE